MRMMMKVQIPTESGNDAIKVRFVNTLRQTQAKSVFAEDLKALAAN